MQDHPRRMPLLHLKLENGEKLSRRGKKDSLQSLQVYEEATPSTPLFRTIFAEKRSHSPLVHIMIKVADTGIGLSSAVKKELFQSFWQADGSHTRRYGGAGLGLAFSKKLALEMGGDVRLIDSRLQRGSKFQIDLNLEQVGDQWIHANSSGTIQPSTCHTAKILLVEDSEDNQEIFEYFLTSAGHHVTTVGNGADAVILTAQENFDLILMDIQIPGLDGKEATRQIRRAGYGKPILALTAHARPEQVADCLEAGCNGQITKPVSARDLLQAIEFYMQNTFLSLGPVSPA